MATTTSSQSPFAGGTLGADPLDPTDLSRSSAGSRSVDDLRGDVPRITDVAEPPGSGVGGMGGGNRADELMSRVVQGAHDAIDRLAETAAPHVHSLGDGMGRYSETLHERTDHWRETGDEWAESLRHTVRERPIAAVGVALAVGLLVARITR